MSTGESEKISLFRDIGSEAVQAGGGGWIPGQARNDALGSWDSLASGEEKCDLPGLCRG